MFDAKAILDAITKNTGQPPSAGTPGGQGGGGLQDILEQVLRGGGPNGTAPAQNGQGGGLEDILRQLLPNSGAPAQSASPGGANPPDAGGGGLADILDQLKNAAGPDGGNLLDTLGKVLGQATQGVKEGAGQIGEATGARDAFGQATGQTPEQVIARIKDLIANNQLGAGAALGGLGGLLLGTQTGRSLAAGAAKVGALALIGGLAYKAYQNYAAGKPLITGADTATPPPPAGSGFEPASVTNERASLFIQAMIAAAAADGRVDGAEQQKIVASLKQAGLDSEAEQFLANALNNPATAAELASAVHDGQEAVQLYTAARIAIEPDSPAETRFLGDLANRLGLDRDLVAHIDATTRSAAA
jgi:uncharacterized membrane protein YebE (DUF533 family)